MDSMEASVRKLIEVLGRLTEQNQQLTMNLAEKEAAEQAESSNQQRKKLYFVKALIGPRKATLRFLADSGSSVNVLPRWFCEANTIVMSPSEHQSVLDIANEKRTVLGKVNLPVVLAGHELVLEFLVLDGARFPIIGLPGLQRFGVNIDCAQDQLLFADGQRICAIVERTSDIQMGKNEEGQSVSEEAGT